VKRLKDVPATPTPELVAQVVSFVAEAPGMGRPWLALGRLFEMEGAREEARAAYSCALERLWPGEMSGELRFTWSGLARALYLLRRSTFVDAWWRMVRRDSVGKSCWYGLRDAIEPVDASLLETTFRAGLGDPTHGGVAAEWLGALLLRRRRDPDAARQAWRGALTASPRSKPIVESLAMLELVQGHFDRAVQLLADRGPEDRHW
jgi:hypothetical protein